MAAHGLLANNRLLFTIRSTSRACFVVFITLFLLTQDAASTAHPPIPLSEPSEIVKTTPPGSISAASSSLALWDQIDLKPNLKAYIEHEEFRLKVISNNFSKHEEEVPFVEQRISEFKKLYEELEKNSTEEVKDDDIRHPTTAFASLRDYLANWEEKLENETIYGERLREFLSKDLNFSLPVRTDLAHVGTGLAIIQATYNLSMADLLSGNVMGVQGKSLGSADCYDIGITVLSSGLLDAAHEWLETAINSSSLTADDNEVPPFNLTDALTTLAKISYQRRDHTKALDLFEKAVELDPDNLVVHQDYMKHRFGRDVEPLSELDRDSVEPWRKKFFDMCLNSTDPSQVDQLQKPLQKGLFCRYKRSKFAPYLTYKQEVLSRAPYISTILDFLWPGEIKQLKNATLSKLTPFKLHGNNPGIHWQSMSASFKDSEGDILGQVSSRAGDVTGLDVTQKPKQSFGEPIHVYDYGISGLALPHAEFKRYYSKKYMGSLRGKRYATVHVFLSEVKAGGAAVFINQNVTVLPRQGMAILWYNYKPNGQIDQSLYPATCPLAVGENIILEKGIFKMENYQTSICGRKPELSHVAVERSQALADAYWKAKSDSQQASQPKKEKKQEEVAKVEKESAEPEEEKVEKVEPEAEKEVPPKEEDEKEEEKAIEVEAEEDKAEEKVEEEKIEEKAEEKVEEEKIEEKVEEEKAEEKVEEEKIEEKAEEKVEEEKVEEEKAEEKVEEEKIEEKVEEKKAEEKAEEEKAEEKVEEKAEEKVEEEKAEEKVEEEKAEEKVEEEKVEEKVEEKKVEEEKAEEKVEEKAVEGKAEGEKTNDAKAKEEKAEETAEEKKAEAGKDEKEKVEEETAKAEESEEGKAEEGKADKESTEKAEKENAEGKAEEKAEKVNAEETVEEESNEKK